MKPRFSLRSALFDSAMLAWGEGRVWGRGSEIRVNSYLNDLGIKV